MSPVQPILLAAALYNLVLVAIILWKTRTRQAGRNLAWYILGTAGWTVCVAMMRPAYGEETAVWLARATFFCATCFSIAWLWFCTDFPVVSSRFRIFAWVMTLVGLPWAVLCWTPSFVPAVHFQVTEGWVDAVVGPLVNPFNAWLGACGVAGLIHLIYKIRYVRGFERLQLRYIILGGIGLLVAGSIPNLILPALFGTSRYALLGPLATLFVTTTTTYAIVRYRLMDIKIVLRAGLVYSLTIGTLSLLFALLVPTFNGLLTERLSFPSSSGSFIMAFLMALAFQPLRQYVQHVVDLRFFKSVYDYRLTLREAGNALASARDRELLVSTLVNALVRTLRPRGVVVYLPGTNETLIQVTGTSIWAELPHTFATTDTLLLYALETDDAMLSQELIRQPDPQYAIGLRLKSWGAEVVLPLIAGGQIRGIVVLGEKLSGDVYTADDIGLLRILGKQAAIALDNARHYDEMVLLNEYHERLLHIMQDGVLALDPDGRILTFNPAAEEITGVRAAEAPGRRLHEIGLTQLPTYDTEGQAVETMLTVKGGEIPVLVSVTPFVRRWETTPCRLLVFRDLSALRALEEEKVQAERFSSMGAMAASLAHEIKNPLVPIQMFAHMLPTRFDDAEFREEFSKTVVNEVERINRLVGQMLDLVRKPVHDRGVVDLREVVERLLILLRPECDRNGITVHLDVPEELPLVPGVVGQLYQAILNVLTNSVQVLEDGGELWITLAADDEAIICRIRDTGPGVAEDDLSRIFEPLYTTTPGGHGLGLALTYQFVRSHGGEIHAESPENGRGLLITIKLPVWRHDEAELICS